MPNYENELAFQLLKLVRKMADQPEPNHVHEVFQTWLDRARSREESRIANSLLNEANHLASDVLTDAIVWDSGHE